MKLLCDRERLREGLSLVGGVIPNKATRPAIENVLLVATDDALELVGTDLEVAMRLRIDDVKVGEPGTALVPAKVLSDFVRDLTGETVNLSVGSGRMEISSGSDRCELPIADPEEFPVVARFEDQGALSIQGGSFTRLVGRTGFAAAKEQGRYAMHGILTLVEDQVLRMVATDGRRLAVASTPIDGDEVPPAKAILPTKGGSGLLPAGQRRPRADRAALRREPSRPAHETRRDLRAADRRRVPALRGGDPERSRAPHRSGRRPVDPQDQAGLERNDPGTPGRFAWRSGRTSWS